MKHILDMVASGILDKLSQEEYGIPDLVLMEQAGARLWQLFKEKYASDNDKLVFICGTGNNGGDAMVMSRYAYFSGFKSITVIVTKNKLKNIPALQYGIIKKLGIAVHFWDADSLSCKNICKNADWIIDGIMGIGQRDELRPEIAEIVDFINSLDSAKVFSVDVPTGLKNKKGLFSDVTVNIGTYKKECFYPDFRKKIKQIHLAEIAFPVDLIERLSSAYLLENADFKKNMIFPSAFLHKGSRGKIGIWAGSALMMGAAFLSSNACLRTPSGYVFLFLRDKLLSNAVGNPGAIVLRNESDEHTIKNIDYAVAGPGWGRDESRVSVLKSILSKVEGGVIDADALYALKKIIDADKGFTLRNKWILTPHPGECAFLMDTSVENILQNPMLCSEFAKKYSCILVLKSYVTWIFSPDKTAVYDAPFSPIGTAGSGDVLSGIIGGLLTSYSDAFDAACAGVIAHSYAGRKLYKEKGWFSSDMLLDYVGSAIRELGVDADERRQ